MLWHARTGGVTVIQRVPEREFLERDYVKSESSAKRLFVTLRCHKIANTQEEETL